MAIVPRRIYHINDLVANIDLTQLCFEPLDDADLDFRMWCGKDEDGNVTRWLAKDEKARVTQLWLNHGLTMGSSSYLMHDTNGLVSGGHIPVLSAVVGANTPATGALVFAGSGVSQGGTGGRTFTFTNTTYTSGSFDHGGLGRLNDDDHNGTNGYLRTDGARALGGAWSLGGFDLSNANQIIGAASVTTPGSQLYYTLDAGIDYGDGVLFSGATFWDEDNGLTSWVGAGDDGTAQLVATDGTKYSLVKASSADLRFSDPFFQASASWTTDEIKLAATSTEVTALFNFGRATALAPFGTAGAEKSLVSAILTAAHLPQYAIAVGDANHYQSGDTTKLSLRNDLGDSLNWLILSSAFGIAVGQETQFKTTVGSFFFHDSFCNWESVAGIPLSSGEQNWTDLAALIGSEGSLVDGILAAAGSGGGTLEDAYNFGGPGLGGLAFINSGPVHLNNGNATGPNLPILYLTQAYEGATAPWFTVSNASTAGAPSVVFQGAAGGSESTGGSYNIGHRIWTADSISIGRTNTQGKNAYFSATKISDSSGWLPAVAQIYASANADNGSGLSEGYLRIQANGQEDGIASTGFNLYATTGTIGVNANHYLSIDARITDVKGVTHGPTATALVWNTATPSVNFGTGLSIQTATLTANATSISVTRPPGAGIVSVSVLASGADRTFTSVKDATTGATFIKWLFGDGNPDEGSITIPSGTVCDISIKYTNVTGTPAAIGIVVLQ